MQYTVLNWDKSAANFCHQVATLVSDMFCDFYLGKNNKTSNNSTTTKAGDEAQIWNPQNFRIFLIQVWLFTGRKSLIFWLIYIGNVFTAISPATATCDSHYLVALATLGEVTVIEMILIAKISNEGDIVGNFTYKPRQCK